MANLNHFLLNSDIESLKIVGRDTLTINLSATSIDYNTGIVTTSKNVTVSSGVYIDLSSAICSWIPGVALGGSVWGYFSKNMDDDTSGNYRKAEVRVDVKRTSSTKYTISVDESVAYYGTASHNAITIPAMTVTVKLLRLVPTDQ